MLCTRKRLCSFALGLGMHTPQPCHSPICLVVERPVRLLNLAKFALQRRNPLHQLTLPQRKRPARRGLHGLELCPCLDQLALELLALDLLFGRQLADLLDLVAQRFRCF